MKTTIDIPSHELEEVMRNTGASTKREAVVTAVAEFNRRKALEDLADRFGTFENVMTLEELLQLRETD